VSHALTVRGRSLSLSTGELSGAVGDAVTVLPIAVGVAALTDLGLAPILFGFAVFQVVWGLYYGLPVSVEPMKALAALVIAGALSTGEFVAAGLLAGAVLLVFGATGSLARLRRYVARPVVRGVQLAVALLLLRTGLRLGVADPRLAGAGVAIALVAVVAGFRRAVALLVLGFGLAVALGQPGAVSSGLPDVSLHVPTAGLSPGALQATVAQLAMTVGNAAVATSLLLSEYFDADVSPDELAPGLGAMTLLAVPLGCLPMCHGSGGLAGKYAFGARSAVANLLLGGLYAAAAIGAVGLVARFPMAGLGVVLALVALQLGRTALDTDDFALTVGVGLAGLLVDVGVAFVLGSVVALVLDRTTVFR
jgi:MFS superfamily sulfate permease-like transporter